MKFFIKIQKKKVCIKMVNLFEKLKYNFFLKFFNNKKKLLWTLVNNSLTNLISTPTISVLHQSTDTNIGKKGEKIFVTNDSYQTWYIMNDKNFHQNLIDNLKNIINKNNNYNFIDVGANTGLLIKSVLNNFDNIKHSYLIEPDKDNFFCAQNNLKSYKDVQIYNFALDIKDGEKKLFIDKNNKGNLSFNFEMMKFKHDKLSFMNSENNFEIVNCKRIDSFFENINNDLKNIIKIDVQGYDEIIFQEIPINTLIKTDIIILEITPLNSKRFNLEKFISKLEYFDKFTDFENRKFTKEDIIKFTQITSGNNIDIIMYKGNE